MTTYNIFYDSNKEIIWSSTADVNSTIINAEATKGFTHVALDSTDIPVSEKFYINSDASAVSTKTLFDPTFSTSTAAVDTVINVTDVPSGTEVFLDGASVGTMSDTTLTLTAQQAGSYKLKFTKDKYQDYTTSYTVTRYGV
jgi:hypothetical protein